jgi:prepilin signal peptidase PulO-like enzyme (type II secretory pathway)
MLMKIGGLARAVAIVLAIVAAFVPLAMMNVPLVLVILGLVAGLAMAEDRLVLSTVTLIALPIIGTALGTIPSVGAQFAGICTNLQMAIAGALATTIAIRLYHMTMDGVTGLTGMAGGAAATAAR